MMTLNSRASWPQEVFSTEREFKEWKEEFRHDINAQVQRLCKEFMSEIRTLVQPVIAARHRSPPPPRHYTQPTHQYVLPQRDRWDDKGRPICRKCKLPGHIVRFCRVRALQSERDVANQRWARQERFSGGFDSTEGEERAQRSEERNQVLTGMMTELRDQVHEMKEERRKMESAVSQLQQDLADSEEKLCVSEASLEVSMQRSNDLEDEKSRLIHDVERLKNKLQESEDRCNQAERRFGALKSSLNDKDREMCAITQRLQGAVKALEKENGKLEAAAKQQRDEIEVMRKEALEAVRRPERAAGEREEEKGVLASETDTEEKAVRKMVEQKEVMDGMLEEEDLFLQKQRAVQEPLDRLIMTTGSNMCSGQEQRIRSLVWVWRLWEKLGRREFEMDPSRYDTV